MDTNVWFNDPTQLFKSDRILSFWPTSQQDPATRINATARFIIYAACLIYLIKRDIRVFALAAMVLFVIFILYKNGMVKQPDARPMHSYDQSYNPSCQRPTFDNPMGNVLISDYIDQPNRPPACDYSTVRNQVKYHLDDTIPYDGGRSRTAMPEFQRNAAARQFPHPLPRFPGIRLGSPNGATERRMHPCAVTTPPSATPTSAALSSRHMAD
jgi:Family of unknown function (DUF5762)